MHLAIYRVLCVVLFAAIMIPAGIGLRALKATQDGTLIYGVCGVALLAMFAFALWYDRRNSH